MPDAPQREIVWQPNEGPQTALLECQVEDCFYGGARGGGKTDGLLGDFLAHAGRYGTGARGIFFRRTLPELDDVISRAKEIYGPLGWTYREQKHDWVASNGATLRLRFLDKDQDAGKYQGHSYTWLAFDELTQWPDPRPVDLLWGTLRSAAGVPCVRRSTGNPGGPGHGWVKRRYIDHGPYRVVAWNPSEDRPDLVIRSVFIPSLLDDNKKLMEKDPTYEAKLWLAGGKTLARAWRYGDWDVLAGQYFDLWSPELHLVRRGEYALEPWHLRWISADWGYEDDTVVLWHRIDENKRIVTYRELRVNHTSPDKIGAMIVAKIPRDAQGDFAEHYTHFYLSPDAFDKRHSERSIADEIWAGAERAVPRPVKADDARVSGWSLMYQMLQSGMWKIDGDACPHLVDSMPLLVRDTSGDPEDIAESKFDHAPDAARYGLKSHVRNVSVPVHELEMARAAQIVDITSRNIALMRLEEKQRNTTVGFRRRRYA